MAESPITPESPEPAFQELLDHYSDISVERDRTGGFYITKTLPDGSVIMEALALGGGPEILISARREKKGEEGEPATENWGTYISIKRASGGPLEAEVTYPKRKDKRLDPTVMFAMAIKGLELFDGLKRATPLERTTYIYRVTDLMGENEQDLEVIGRQVNELLPETEQFDIQAVRGTVKMIGMVLRNASSIPIINRNPDRV